MWRRELNRCRHVLARQRADRAVDKGGRSCRAMHIGRGTLYVCSCTKTVCRPHAWGQAWGGARHTQGSNWLLRAQRTRRPYSDHEHEVPVGFDVPVRVSLGSWDLRPWKLAPKLRVAISAVREGGPVHLLRDAVTSHWPATPPELAGSTQ